MCALKMALSEFSIKCVYTQTHTDNRNTVFNVLMGRIQAAALKTLPFEGTRKWPLLEMHNG
jgi:hypothetical protein